MHFPKIYQIIAPLLLVVFTVTSCNIFSMPVITPKDDPVPVHSGDLGVFFLDEFYEPTINDIGKLALYVENNDDMIGILVTAEIRDNHIDNDVVVRILNSNSIGSFFYRSNQQFPYKMVMSIDDDNVIAEFSPYDTLTEMYSVEFYDSDGESELVEGFVLNQNKIFLYEHSDLLSETQNVRVQCIYTTLALGVSLGEHISYLESLDNDNARFLKKLFKVVNKISFYAASLALACAVISAVAVIIPIAPAVVATVTTVMKISAVVSLACFLVGEIIRVFINDEDSLHSLPPHSENRRVQIQITTLNGIKIINNQMPPYNLDHGESLTFDLKITDFASFYHLDDIVDRTNFMMPLEPNDNTHCLDVDIEYITYRHGPEEFYTYIQTTVTRNGTVRQDEDTVVKYMIPLLTENVIINDISTGVLLGDETSKDIFILNFAIN